MKKLTAYKCREQIEECRALKERGYLSINGEYKLQALEIALPVLEQQEKVNDGWGDWLDWVGGPIPVSEIEFVEYRKRSGLTDSCFADDIRWNHKGDMGDIIAYRVIENDGGKG